MSSFNWPPQGSANAITALTGDVTASGPGSAAATLTATSNGTLTHLTALTNIGTIGGSSPGTVIAGTEIGASAPVGAVGETAGGTQSTFVNLTTTQTYQSVASLSLGAGRWVISGHLTFTLNGATCTSIQGQIGTSTPAWVAPGTANVGLAADASPTASNDVTLTFPVQVTAGSATVHIYAAASFSAGNPQVLGSFLVQRVF